MRSQFWGRYRKWFPLYIEYIYIHVYIFECMCKRTVPRRSLQKKCAIFAMGDGLRAERVCSSRIRRRLIAFVFLPGKKPGKPWLLRGNQQEKPEDVAGSASKTVETASPPRRSMPEPLAVLGLACRLPGAASVANFWQALQAGHRGGKTRPKENAEGTPRRSANKYPRPPSSALLPLFSGRVPLLK